MLIPPFNYLPISPAAGPGKLETIRSINPLIFDFKKIPGRYIDFPIWVTDGEPEAQLIKDIEWAINCSALRQGGKIVFFQTKKDEANLKERSISALQHSLELFKDTKDFASEVTAQNWDMKARSCAAITQSIASANATFKAKIKGMSIKQIEKLRPPRTPDFPIDDDPIRNLVYRYLASQSNEYLATLFTTTPTYISDSDTFVKYKTVFLPTKLANSYWSDVQQYVTACQRHHTFDSARNLMPAYVSGLERFRSDDEGPVILTARSGASHIDIEAESFTAEGQRIDVTSIPIPIVDQHTVEPPATLTNKLLHISDREADVFSEVSHLIFADDRGQGPSKEWSLPQLATLLFPPKSEDITNIYYQNILPRLASALGDYKIRACIPDEALAQMLRAHHGPVVNLGLAYQALNKHCILESSDGTLTISPIDLYADAELQANRESLARYASLIKRYNCVTVEALLDVYEHQSPNAYLSPLMNLAYQINRSNHSWIIGGASQAEALNYWLVWKFYQNDGNGSSVSTIPAGSLPSDWRVVLGENAKSETLGGSTLLTPVMVARTTRKVSPLQSERVAADTASSAGTIKISLSRINALIPKFYDLQGKVVSSGWKTLELLLPTDPNYKGSLHDFIDQNYTVTVNGMQGYQGVAIVQDGVRYPIDATLRFTSDKAVPLSEYPDIQNEVLATLEPIWQKVKAGELRIVGPQ